jgi:hypothetical protein
MAGIVTSLTVAILGDIGQRVTNFYSEHGHGDGRPDHRCRHDAPWRQRGLWRKRKRKLMIKGGPGQPHPLRVYGILISIVRSLPLPGC